LSFHSLEPPPPSNPKSTISRPIFSTPNQIEATIIQLYRKEPTKCLFGEDAFPAMKGISSVIMMMIVGLAATQ
jgi:hypothetical protein